MATQFEEQPLFRSQRYAIDPAQNKWDALLEVYGPLIELAADAAKVVPGTPGWKRIRTLQGVAGFDVLYIYYTKPSPDRIDYEAVELSSRLPPVPTFFEDFPS